MPPGWIRTPRLLWLVPLLAGAAIAQTPFTGRVLDEHGDGIAGVAVQAMPANEFVNIARLLQAPATESRANGTFSVTIAARAPTQIVLARKGRQSCVRVLPQPQGASRTLGDIVLPPGGRLIGRVRDRDGQPVAGARIAVRSAFGQRASHANGLALLSGTSSNEQGIFIVPCVPHTAMTLTASCDGYRDQRRLVAQDSPLNLTLQPLQLITGRVVDEAGNGLASALVTVQTPRPDDDAKRLTLTRPDGSFSLHAPPANERYRIEVHGPYPHRESSSGLLRGPQADVVIQAGTKSDDAVREVRIQARNRTSRDPLAQLLVAPLRTRPERPQSAVLEAQRGARTYSEQAIVRVRTDHTKALWIAAPGHAFAIVPLPASTEPLIVDLDRESIITGVVRDQQGNAVAGVKVRALPRGNVRGSAPLSNDLPETDADGRFRIGNLRAGEYSVQAHAPKCRPSAPTFVTTTPEQPRELALTLPATHAARFTIGGKIPQKPRIWLGLHRNTATPSGPGDFLHAIDDVSPMQLSTPGPHTFEPLRSPTAHILAFWPSRTRIGSGTTQTLGSCPADGATHELRLPDLHRSVVRGRVRPSKPIDTRFLAVVATLTGGKAAAVGLPDMPPSVAGVDSAGRFAIDLPHGKYCLQIADLRTGVVIHTEANDHIIDGQPLTLRPAVHWLEVACEPTDAEQPIVLASVELRLPRPRKGKHAAFYPAIRRSGSSASSPIRWPRGTREQRWLVPPGTVHAAAICRFEVLRPNRAGKRMEQRVSHAETEIEDVEHTVLLVIPPPPTDAEVLGG